MTVLIRDKIKMVFLSSHIPLPPMGHQFKIMLLENEGNVEFQFESLS
jgi:hypothetical protein